MDSVKYISYYDSNENKDENRNVCLSAITKMDYICSAIKKNNYNIEIISASRTRGKHGVKSKKYNNEYASVKLFSSLGCGNKIKNLIDYVYLQMQLFFYCLFNISKEETVIVYHSLGYMRLISILKTIKKFRLILEVEEIYSHVTGKAGGEEKELKFFEKADGYIFPTELLNEKVNVNNKPYVIIYGTYMPEKKYDTIFNDNIIHCVYAGTLDPRKGALTAAKAASLLGKDYHVHVLGFGSEKDKQLIIDEVDLNRKNGYNNLSFDGLLGGEEYLRFIQSCQVGFSTQSPSVGFNETSFPSKVLSYLSNGLRVVSIDIESIRCSKVSDLLYFYHYDTPKSIADTVKSIDFSDGYDSRKLINGLDKGFTDSINTLLKNVGNYTV